MNDDMTVQCGDGIINIRVGAIIMKDGKILMVGNTHNDYLYSVGGRIKFGETAEQAIVREVLEETGVKMEVERLGFVHENYFIADSQAKGHRKVYEISFFFYMKVPDSFTPVSNSFTEDDTKEFLQWVSLDEKRTIYPEFFRTELAEPKTEVIHIVSDDTKKQN